MNICIVIPTYRRNQQLLALIGQCQGFVKDYRGSNTYQVCVTDSDRSNPLAETIKQAGVRYVTNPGEGFDDNLYNFYKSFAGNYDFIFSISDDDLFFKQGVNPLHLLDVAALLDKDAVMFNHRDYQQQANAGISLRPTLYYKNPLLSCNDDIFTREVLSLLPRHVGLLYSTRILKKYDSVISQFRGTLHLYAVPAILSAVERNAAFLDYCLCLFHEETHDDGAWENLESVFNGLLLFLVKLQAILPADLYQIAEAGFMANYLGDQSWLRKMVSPKHAIADEKTIRKLLAGNV